MSKSLATRLKETLPDLITYQQTAYVKNWFIGEGVRVLSDILEIRNIFNLTSTKRLILQVIILHLLA